MLYFVFVQSNVDDGLIVWGSATTSPLKPTQINIKKTIRKMLFKKSNHPTEPLINFDKLKLLKMGIFMWEVLHDEVPQTLKNHFSIRERNLGNQDLKFRLAIANTNLFKSDTVYQGPKLWNTINSDIRSKKVFLRLKLPYNNYLLQNINEKIIFLTLVYFLFI